MKILKIILSALLVLAIMSCGGGDPNGIKDVAATKALFEEQKCATCHGANGEGGIGPNLKTGLPASKTVDQISAQITNGSGVMPAFKDKLSKDQINELAKYVYKELQGR